METKGRVGIKCVFKQSGDMSDLVTFGETMVRLSPPDRARLETADSLEFRTAGAESNVAIVAQRLGTPATWISKLPTSPLGRRVAGDIERHGVAVDVTWSEEGRQGTYYLEQGTEPRRTTVLYDRQGSAVTEATVEGLPVETIRSAEVFFTTGITPALSDTLRRTTGELARLAEEADTRVAFDFNYRSKLWSPETACDTLEKLFPSVDLLVIAERDARTVLGRSEDPEDIAHGMATDYGIGTVLLTLGSNGALCHHDGVIHEQEAVPAETVDPIGTGDAFTGAFLARRIAGESVQTALEYAAATASIKRTIPGDVAVVTPTEVEEVLEDAMDSSGISR